MSTRTWTVWILITISLLLIGWDIYAAVTPEKGDTISRVILSTAEKHPILPFALGVLMGHLLWWQTYN